jgi:hypothetical protein
MINGQHRVVAGIFSGMKSAYSSDDVFADLGDKVVNGFAIAVRCARRDLTAYRQERAG